METKEKCVAQAMVKDAILIVASIIGSLLVLVGIAIIGKISAYFGLNFWSIRNPTFSDRIAEYFINGGVIIMLISLCFVVFLVLREEARLRCK